MLNPYDMALASVKSVEGGSKDAMPSYAPFGQYAKMFKDEGWYPEMSYNGVTVYRSNFQGPHNQVMLNGKPTGHIAFLGNSNGKFSVVIRDDKGNIVHTIATNQTPDALAAYTKNDISPVAVRNNRIISQAKMRNAGTTAQK